MENKDLLLVAFLQNKLQPESFVCLDMWAKYTHWLGKSYGALVAQGLLPPINVFQDTPTSTSATAVSSSSAGMQGGGKWWTETSRLGGRGVAQAWARCAACLFCWTGLTGGYMGSFMQTGLTGWLNRSDRLSKGWTLEVLWDLFCLKLATLL